MINFDEMAEIYSKCYADKTRIYMIQTFLKTFDGTQGREVPFALMPRQQVLCESLSHEDCGTCTTKYRQAGISTVGAAFIACEMILCAPDSPKTALIIGNTLDIAQQMFFKLQEFLMQFPLWVWGDEYFEDGSDPMSPPENKNVIFDKCNDKKMFLKNGCKIYARSSGPDASRGISACHFLCFDECAFIENAKDVYAAALPTTSSVKSKTLFISTPNGKDPLYYETCRRAKLKGTSDWNNFELVEMKWFQDTRYNRFLEWTKKDDNTGELIVEKEEVLDDKGNVPYNEEKWQKLIDEGWLPRSPWYVKMCRQFNNDSQKIAQELDVSFLGSASNVVDPEFIEMQHALNEKEPLYVDPMNEDTWIWKEPIVGHKYIMSIDCSRGDAADRTAIEILDMDGIDEKTGEPILEQVLEYHGKRTGDVIGEMAYQYGMMYGEAFCTVDCVGGTGDACVLTMQRLGYKNLYYDDPELKTYTMQREQSSLKVTTDGRLPGFHSSSVRFQMLTYFANMVKTNQIKIRSKRVIAELDTWIYKGPAARIDHQDGCHDDTLTCLAMAVFVMRYSLGKLKAAQEKDKVLLKAWTTSNSVGNVTVKRTTEISIEPKKKSYNMPFYTNNNGRGGNDKFGAYRWLIR